MRILTVILALLLGACATTSVPEAVREAPSPTVLPADVRKGPVPVGTQVRWGGTIAKIENRKDSTWLEIVERNLDKNGKPRDADVSSGRFIAYVDGFLEPTVYTSGRKITVVGKLQESRHGTIGDFPYVFPVVKVTEHYLWPREPERIYSPGPPSPYWYDPWYPWGYGYGYYPWRPYPWWW